MTFFTASSSFHVTRHKCSALETCFNADMRSHCWRSNSPPLLEANLPPPHPEVIFHKPAGGQTLPSQPSGHPSPLLSANLIPPHPAVILPTPILLAVKLSPLSSQRSSFTPAVSQPHPTPPRSSSTHPVGGQTLPSPHSVHLPPILLAVKLSPPESPQAVMAVKLSLLRQAVIFHPCWRPSSPLPTWQSWRSNYPLPPSGIERTDLGIETTDLGIETTDLGIETTDGTDLGIETTDLGIETTDLGIETPTWA